MSSGFITETEIEAAKKKRQEDWERVRKADDPLEAPEPTYDSRSLYERLQEQKQKRDLEYEEAHKLKNMIKGLDDDEIEFLDLVDKTKMAVDRRKMIEEEKELNDYRNRVASLNEENVEKKKQTDTTTTKSKTQPCNRTSQTKLLKGAVVAKSSAVKHKLSDSESKVSNADIDIKEESECKKIKSESSEDKSCDNSDKNVASSLHSSRKRKLIANSTKNCLINKASHGHNSVMKCIGVLPGMGYYSASSSEESSDSDHEIKLTDIIHKPEKKEKEPQQQQ
ncbi:protein FAM192A isoform X1 [Agrilus planipennis]|uniref:Protein FAM192A isoform X1 n=1 Tax=Agrilus planipennis TaxID=224129 RepID=A0A1W4WDG3_AGRPL|nr:protein FAM192A isoform X1 [Agrilus planipennis]XP_018322006.1 protein FAM192A isoform X1 [Agrilus planipennis]